MDRDIKGDSRKTQGRDGGQVETGSVGNGAERGPEAVECPSTGGLRAGPGPGMQAGTGPVGRVGQSEVLNNANPIQFPKRHNLRERQIDFHIKFPLL